MCNLSKLVKLAFVFILMGCTTLPKVGEDKIPAQMSSSFSSCSGIDGALNMEVHSAKNFLGSMDVEWVAKDGGWRLELVDRLGSAALRLDYKNQEKFIRQIGPLAGRIPEISVDDDLWLRVDGHKVALKIDELPCLLSFTMPYEWLLKFRNVQTFRDGYAYHFREDGRHVDVKFDLRSTGQFQAFCSRVSWPVYWGISQRNIVVCVDKENERLRSRVTGINDLTLKWINIDG